MAGLTDDDKLDLIIDYLEKEECFDLLKSLLNIKTELHDLRNNYCDSEELKRLKIIEKNCLIIIDTWRNVSPKYRPGTADAIIKAMSELVD